MHQSIHSPSEALLRAASHARRLALVYPARLRRVATRTGGDDGHALASAFIDVVRAGTSPGGWPVSAMIELLEAGEAGRDSQADRLLATLRQIEADIDLAGANVAKAQAA